MKVSVTNRHIKDAKESNGRLTPIELAVIGLDMFGEVLLIPEGESEYVLELDTMRVSLPSRVERAIFEFDQTGEMAPLSFEIEVPTDDVSAFDEEEMLLDGFDDGFNFSFGFA